jgi:branched-chain amino acid transport system substrate-binding protein
MLQFRILILSSLVFFSTIVKAEVSVGLILPLSGGAAIYGNACRNGVTLGFEDFKEKINGRFKVDYEDDQNSAAQTVTALRKLRASKKSEFIVSFTSNTSNAINSLADRENFILFALATDPAVVNGKKNVFSYWVTPETETKALIAELNFRKMKKIAVFTAQQTGALAVRDSFLKEAPKYGIEIVAQEEISPEEKDFPSLLAKLTRIKEIDGIFNNLYLDQAGLFAKQLKDRGINAPTFDIEMYENDAVVKNAQGALEGQFFINAPVGEKEFIAKYKSRFPKDSLVGAANCYDFIGLLSSSPELSVSGFRTYLENLKDYPGAAGKSSATGDHRFSLPAIVKEIRGKEFIELER